jgi:uncharacterized membrane protein YcaP (DUF421 family)
MEKWLTQELSKQGISSIKQVFYAELSKNDTLFIQKSN